MRFDCERGQWVLDSGRRFYNLHGPLTLHLPKTVTLIGDEWYPLALTWDERWELSKEVSMRWLEWGKPGGIHARVIWMLDDAKGAKG